MGTHWEIGATHSAWLCFCVLLVTYCTLNGSLNHLQPLADILQLIHSVVHLLQMWLKKAARSL